MSTNKVYQTIVQRYFTSYFLTEFALWTIAPSHKLFQETEITNISFQAKKRRDRTENKVSGKGKRGGQQLEHNSLLCEVECSSGNKYHMRSGIQGKLIEINEELMKHPKLLLEAPENGGYVAIVLPRLKPIQEISQNILSAEQYQEILNLRSKESD